MFTNCIFVHYYQNMNDILSQSYLSGLKTKKRMVMKRKLYHNLMKAFYVEGIVIIITIYLHITTLYLPSDPHSCRLQFEGCHIVIIPTIFSALFFAFVFEHFVFRCYAVINITHLAIGNRSGCFIWI